MNTDSRTDASEVQVPPRYPTSLVFMDESGSKTSGGRFFVMSAVKVRKPGQLQRTIRGIRDRHGFDHEFKFAALTRGSQTVFYELIDALVASDACFHATVVNREVHDPFPGKQQWQVHLEVASQLLVGCINRRELVSVVIDQLSTPEDVAIEEQLRADVNRRLKNGSVVTASMFDSRSNDLLQVADLMASAVGFDRRAKSYHHGQKPASTSSAKALVAARLMSSFGRTSFEDGRNDRVNIATLRPRSAKRAEAPSLRVVTKDSA